MSDLLLRPGLRLGAYPQKGENDLTEFERNAALFFDKIRSHFNRKQLSKSYVVNKVEFYEKPLKACSEKDLTAAISALRENLQRQGLASEALSAQAFAIIREAAKRTLGKRHYDTQLYGGWMMLNGFLAEMATGEGKTITATLPACTAALAGIPVHVITANDYLATRDADMMQPLYRRLGLQAGAVVDGMPTGERRGVYQGDIVHTTNKQVAFDYLRDRIEMGDDTGPLMAQFRQIQGEINPTREKQLILRGLCFALIDEADSVLIDEAKTPLIITQTRASADSPETYSDALYLATSLASKNDFLLDPKTGEIELTKQGEDKLGKLVFGMPKLWQSTRKRDSLVKQALAATYFYVKNKHYVINGNTIQIIDEFTGRIMADRSWQQGLHQMIEAKEGCRISEQRETLAQISYQRFFRRYLRLAGTSGTLQEVEGDMHSFYGLQTMKIPSHKPCVRKVLPLRIYRTKALKQQALLARVTELHRHNRPILIGTGSVAESEEVSAWLTNKGFIHRVLNAKQDKHEADIIAKAGEKKAITVATNMAGRGTDIALGTGVAALGGLHVIALNANEAKRIDRQLFGRCARQGDPGSAESILCLQEPILEHSYNSAMLKVLAKFCPGKQAMPQILARLILALPQRGNAAKQSLTLKQVMQNDKETARLMAFTGKME